MTGFGEGIFSPKNEPPALAEYRANQKSDDLLLPAASLEMESPVILYERKERSRAFHPPGRFLTTPQLVSETEASFTHCLNCTITPAVRRLISDPFDSALKIADKRRCFDAKVEFLVRKWLSEGMEISSGRGILYRFKQKAAVQKQLGREIDAVSLYKGKPDVVFEVKNSGTEYSAKRGRSSVRASAEILSELSSEIRPCLIQVANYRESSRECIGDTGFSVNRALIEKKIEAANNLKRPLDVPAIQIALDDLNRYGRCIGLGLDTDPFYHLYLDKPLLQSQP